MKMKRLFLFFAIVISIPGFCQTLLSSKKVELRKPAEKQQVFACADSLNQFYVFASDKEKVTAFKYNPALFIRDSLSSGRPDGAFTFIAGSSISSDGNPFLYWASDDYSKIASVGYHFSRHSTVENSFRFSYDKETFLSSFSEQGVFYLTTVTDDEQKLNLYSFRNGSPERHSIDLSRFGIKSRTGKEAKLADLFADYPPEKMESKALNPLFSVTAKSKIYADGDALWLTLDHLPNLTQVFRISLSDFTVAEFKIQQPEIPDATSSNSYLKKNRLYQIRISDSQFALSSRNLQEPANQRLYQFTENDTIVEKNSPLFVQTADRKPAALKSTKKFLRRLSGCNAGISVYESPQGLLVTSGGIRNVPNTGSIILGATVGVGLVVSGSGGGSAYLADDLFDARSIQQVFFESVFDENFAHIPTEQQSLAVDHLSGFLHENARITSHYLVPFQGYYVFAYYDAKAKSVVLRKFSDTVFEF